MVSSERAMDAFYARKLFSCNSNLGLSEAMDEDIGKLTIEGQLRPVKLI